MNQIRINKVKSLLGFTLMELMVTLAILGIIVTIAIPNMSNLTTKQRLVGAAEQVYGHIEQARSESIISNTNAYVNFAVDGTSSWEYGVSRANSLCNLAITSPTTANACVIVVDDGDGNVDPGDGTVDTGDLILMRFTDADYDGVAISIANFSSGNTQFVFDPARGASTSGQVNLVGEGGNLLRINVSLLGRVTICSPDGSVANYTSTGC